MKELHLVYSAPIEEAALIVLDRLEENKGNKYSLSIRTWRQNCTTTRFDLPIIFDERLKYVLEHKIHLHKLFYGLTFFFEIPF